MEMKRMFVSENEIEEKRRKRQEDWEKVRTAEQPEQAPEEEVDNRSLYDRLQEQKVRKQEEFDEARKLKNLVRGIDDDESDFLGAVDEFREKADRQKRLEEQRELKEFHERRAKHMAEELEAAVKPEASVVGTSKSSVGAAKKSKQQQLVLQGVKRKRPSNEEKKRESGSGDSGESKEKKIAVDGVQPTVDTQTCRVLLPGMDCYAGSSSDESDSDDDQPDLRGNYDLLGRGRGQGSSKKKSK